MADGRWDKRSLFVEVEISEKDVVMIGLAIAEGTYTIQEAEQIVRRVQKQIDQAKKIRKLVRDSKSKGK